MKKVTITHELEITFIKDFSEDELDFVMEDQERYLKLVESRMKKSFGFDDLHIKDLKLFIHEGEV